MAKQLVCEHLLGDMQAAGRSGLPAATLQRSLARAGYALDEPTLAEQLHELAAKGLVADTRSALSAGLIRWAITTTGTEFLKSEGLA